MVLSDLKFSGYDLQKLLQQDQTNSLDMQLLGPQTLKIERF